MGGGFLADIAQRFASRPEAFSQAESCVSKVEPRRDLSCRVFEKVLFIAANFALELSRAPFLK